MKELIEKIEALIRKAKALSQEIRDRDQGKATKKINLHINGVYDQQLYDGEKQK